MADTPSTRPKDTAGRITAAMDFDATVLQIRDDMQWELVVSPHGQFPASKLMNRSVQRVPVSRMSVSVPVAAPIRAPVKMAHS
jgi:hypothetical protein